MHRAFSLVELSIVLVIIGLITGGILAGQSLVRASELRAFTTETSRYVAAVNAFRDKYQQLPGDMGNATAYWGKDNANCSWHTGTAATPGTCNGDGNGKIVWDYTAGEDLRAWQQLAMAGLIEGSYTGFGEVAVGGNVPASKVSRAAYGLYTSDWMGFASNHAAATARLRLIFGAPRVVMAGMTFMNNSVLKPEEAWNLDTKMDDGKASTGLMTVLNGDDATSSCIGSGPAYDFALSNSAKTCKAMYVVF